MRGLLLCPIDWSEWLDSNQRSDPSKGPGMTKLPHTQLIGGGVANRTPVLEVSLSGLTTSRNLSRPHMFQVFLLPKRPDL